MELVMNDGSHNRLLITSEFGRRLDRRRIQWMNVKVTSAGCEKVDAEETHANI
jgi:hypothetical protein